MYTGQIYIIYVVSDLIALLIGFIIGRFLIKHKAPTPVGTFVINHDDPTKDLCTLCLDVDLDVIEASKAISFDVAIINKTEE